MKWSCERAFATMNAARDGEASADETAALRDHVRGCEPCRRRQAVLDAVIAELRSHRMPSTAAAPASARQSLAGVTRDGPARPSGESRRRSAPARVRAAALIAMAAAAVALVAGGAILPNVTAGGLRILGWRQRPDGLDRRLAASAAEAESWARLDTQLRALHAEVTGVVAGATADASVLPTTPASLAAMMVDLHLFPRRAGADRDLVRRIEALLDLHDQMLGARMRALTTGAPASRR